jgi:histone H3/H4
MSDIPRAAFSRLVHDNLPTKFRISGLAKDLLQSEGEAQAVVFFEKIKVLADAAGRETVTLKDANALRKLDLL